MERPNDKPPVATMREWLGLYSNADPEDLPPGAMEVQRNCGAVKQGLLAVRPGLRQVTFDN